MSRLSPLERFSQVVAERHCYAREWKERTGRRVVGVLCTYVPEEILYAAGMLPVRVLGSHQPQDVTEPYIYGMYCPFCRDCLAQALQGRYDYLDGLVKAHSCTHMRNVFGAWPRQAPLAYTYFISTPLMVQSRHARAFLRTELATFRQSLEEWIGQAIPEPALDQAIEVYNTNRRLLRELYQTRKATSPPLSGAEAMEVTLSAQLMDKAEHNHWLGQLLQELPQQTGTPTGSTRLMLVGTELDDIEFIRLVESLGGTVVVDDHCTGSRYFWNEVIPEEDALMAIAARYLDRPPCPARDFPDYRRWQHILRLAQDYQVKGVILFQQKFCSPYEFEIPGLQALLREHHLPSLLLEYDLGIPLGQYRTRLEAFLEML